MTEGAVRVPKVVNREKAVGSRRRGPRGGKGGDTLGAHRRIIRSGLFGGQVDKDDQ